MYKRQMGKKIINQMQKKNIWIIRGGIRDIKGEKKLRRIGGEKNIIQSFNEL